MSDQETDLVERWRREKSAYNAWGLFVSNAIRDAISHSIDPAYLDQFFRIPLTHRTKGDASLLAKAFHRGKNYKDPFNDIEDKVGVRVVVLFSEEVREVESVICKSDHWNFEKARDFEEERASRPFEFDYQSVHYIVRSNKSITHEGVCIEQNIPCEIQIRTILQHAYSELTHDTIYKPTIKAEPQIKRAAAKSMALIEATDDYFTDVRKRLYLAQAPWKKVASIVDSRYQNFTGLAPDPSPLNTLIIDHYKQWALENFEREIDDFLEKKRFLADFIRERASGDLIYRQPGVLLLYWAIAQAPRAAAAEGPIPSSELAMLYSDLGERIPEASC